MFPKLETSSKMTISTVHWAAQITCLVVTMVVFFIYLFYHLYHRSKGAHENTELGTELEEQREWMICLSEPFNPWIKVFMLPIVGACVGQVFALYFRTFLSLHGYSTESKLRHPNATRLMIGIATIQAICIVCFYLDVIPTTCVDFLGVKTNFFLWFEWLCTVPYMFFLVSIMDVKRQFMHKDDIFIELVGGGALVLLFSNNIPFLPNAIHWVSFIGANVMMATALFWQQYNAYQECNAAKVVFE